MHTPVPCPAMATQRPGRMACLPRCLIALLALAALLACHPDRASAGMRVSARCACGYHKENMPLFGGRANYKVSCLFPALCLESRELVLVNILDPTAKIRDCPGGSVVRYDDPLLAPAQKSPVVASWNLRDRDTTVFLYAGGYVCPRCGKRTLHFVQTGFWD